LLLAIAVVIPVAGNAQAADTTGVGAPTTAATAADPLTTTTTIADLPSSNTVDNHYQQQVAPESVSVPQTTLPASDVSGVVSDDFSGSVLDSSVWSVVDPVGDGSVGLTGTQLALSVGGGVSHDPWSGGDTALRVMQAANDTDFGIEVKFESGLTQGYQGQGLLVEESSGRFVRFDVFGDGRSVYVYSAFVDGSSAVTKVNQKVGLSAPMWLRVTRSGDTWTYATSSDGSAWTVRVSFSQALVVSQVGVFAGNFGSGGSPAPAHTALVDYFFNTASPIIPEDG